MHNWFDQFVKEVLHEAFDTLGTAQREVEISADAQRIDFFFSPGPAAMTAEAAGIPPIFARMARTACLVEHYRRSPDIRTLCGCLRKQLTRYHLQDKEVAMPVLWTLSSGRPTDVLMGFALRPLQGWPAGTYAGPLPALPFRVIVLSELPEDRLTLPLRLLGRGATLRRAMQELKGLSPDTWERQHIPPLLVRLHVANPNAAAPDLTEQEKEIFVNAQEFLKDLEEKYRQQFVQQGSLQLLVHQCARRLGRPLTDDENAQLRARLDTLGPDRLGDVVVDLSPAALAEWLSDPEAT